MHLDSNMYSFILLVAFFCGYGCSVIKSTSLTLIGFDAVERVCLCVKEGLRPLVRIEEC